MKRLVYFFLGFLLVLMLIGWFVIWRSPPYYPLTATNLLSVQVMSAKAYDALVGTLPEPYIVEGENSTGAFLLFGARHTQDPDDPQIAEIRQRWEIFQPTVALIEGRLGFLMPGVMNPVETFGEGGEVNALALRAGIPVYSWEMPLEVEVDYALETFSPEQVALFYVLRPYFSNFRNGKPDDPTAFVQPYLEERTAIPGLEGTLTVIADLDRVWQRDFPAEPDWRDTSDEWGLPGYLGKIAAFSNQTRDEHLARVILELVNQGERVFAVAGSSHAVKVEGVLEGMP